jgi:hypothetical protein
VLFGLVGSSLFGLGGPLLFGLVGLRFSSPVGFFSRGCQANGSAKGSTTAADSSASATDGTNAA